MLSSRCNRRCLKSITGFLRRSPCSSRTNPRSCRSSSLLLDDRDLRTAFNPGCSTDQWFRNQREYRVRRECNTGGSGRCCGEGWLGQPQPTPASSTPATTHQLRSRQKIHGSLDDSEAEIANLDMIIEATKKRRGVMGSGTNKA